MQNCNTKTFRTQTKTFDGSTTVYDDGMLRVEHYQYHATWMGEILKMTLKEFKLLSYLTHNCCVVIPSTTLWEVGWGSGRPYSHTGIRSHVYRVRKLVEPLGMRIDTVVGCGYKFVPGCALDN